MASSELFEATEVFEWTLDAANYRIMVHQGGSRSSKTYSILQYLIYQALTKNRISITIARSTLTNARDTVYKDFKDILNEAGIYDKFKENLSEYKYTVKKTKSEIQFIGLDKPVKLHGRKQDYIWFNEGNYCTLDDFKQAIKRTVSQMIIDFNPSDLYHWIYDKVLTRDDCILIKSTFLNNPFLPKEQRDEILRMKVEDPDGWKVYGLGERASSKELIYPRYEQYREEPEGCRVMYGLDFGFNHPSALVKCSYRDGELYLKQLVYESYLTTPQLIERVGSVLTKRDEIYADGARPEIIAEFKKAGFNIKAATKDVKHGIDKIKSCKLFINGENLTKEIQTYKYKKHNATDTVLDEPVKENDDLLDAARYGSYHLIGEKQSAPRARVPQRRR